MIQDRARTSQVLYSRSDPVGLGGLVPGGISGSLEWPHLSVILETEWGCETSARRIDSYPCNLDPQVYKGPQENMGDSFPHGGHHHGGGWSHVRFCFCLLRGPPSSDFTIWTVCTRLTDGHSKSWLERRSCRDPGSFLGLKPIQVMVTGIRVSSSCSHYSPTTTGEMKEGDVTT